MDDERAGMYLRLRAEAQLRRALGGGDPAAPPLAHPPDTIEVVVTGRSARVRAVVPVRGGHREGDT